MALLYSALLASLFAHTAYFALIRRYPVTSVAPITVLAPLFSVLFPVLLLGDRLAGRFDPDRTRPAFVQKPGEASSPPGRRLRRAGDRHTLDSTGIVEWRCFMTHTYSAGGSRRTAVFTAIVGFHFGMFLLIASGLVPRPFGPPVEERPEVRLLPPKPEPLEPVAPRHPDPLVEVDYSVPEPHTPVPDFSSRADAKSSDVAATSAAGTSPVVAGSAPDIVPPRLRMHGERLAALVNACYPPGSRRAGEEGRAVVRILVGSQGSILSWRLEQGTGFPRLDAAVRCIIERLVIEPGRRDGRAVEAEALLPIVFRLD